MFSTFLCFFAAFGQIYKPLNQKHFKINVYYADISPLTSIVETTMLLLNCFNELNIYIRNASEIQLVSKYHFKL